MLIEALGPSGVGKSTVTRAAVRKAQAECAWKPGALFDASFRARSVAWCNQVFDSLEMRDLAVWSLDSLAATKMQPSQRISVSGMLRSSASQRAHILEANDSTPVFAEELLLHRGFSFLPYSDDLRPEAIRYYNAVPLPDAAVLFDAPTDDIAARVRNRGDTVNVYRGLTDASLRGVLERAREVSLTAFEVLTGRGLPVLILDTSQPTEETSAKLNEWIGRVVV